MNLTITVCNADEARQAQAVLRAFIASQEPDSPLPQATRLATLDLTTRTLHCLNAQNITTVEELVIREEWQLMSLPNLGRKSLAEIHAALAQRGLTLGMQFS